MKNKLLLAFVVAAVYACSPAKQLAKSAKENVIDAPALQTAHVGLSIYEPATGRYWYNYQGDKYFVPASNTKLPTCYAAMKHLGDSLVGMRYSIVNDSVIIVKGTADPTFLHPDFKNQPVFNLLKRFKRIVVFSNGFNEYFGSGWTWNDYKEPYMAQRNEMPIYANLVKFKWNGVNSIEITPEHSGWKINISPEDELTQGFSLFKRWDENFFVLKSGKTKIAEVPFTPDIKTISELIGDTTKSHVEFSTDNEYFEQKIVWEPIHSQPTDSLLKIMMHRSDNFYAEQSLLMVSNEMLGVMNDEKIIDTLLKTDFKDLPQKPRWADGSGLSRYNLFTPQDFVFILNKMRTDFGMERMKNILETGGTGTISNYYKAENGFIFAKTGSLSGVVALSGYLYTKKNKLLIFSVQVNNSTSSATAVRRAVEKFIEGVRENF